MGLWAGWPSWALVKRADAPGGWMSRSDHSWAVASFDLATLASAWPTGILADRIGRKGCLLTVGCLLTASFGALFVPGRYAVFAARSLAGAAKSVAYATVSAYLAEVGPAGARGRLNVAVAAHDSLGMLTAIMAGPYVRYTIMNGLSVAASIAFLAAVCRVPETPQHLLAVGREDDARRALRWYRAEPVQSTAHQLHRMGRELQEPATWRELFADDGNRAALLLVAGACLAQRAGGIGCVLAYSTTTLPADGPVRPERVAAVVAAVRLALSAPAAQLIDRCGRRPLLIGSHACLAAIAAAYAACLMRVDAAGRLTDWAPSACVVLFAVAYSVGAGVVPAALLGEMFPANVRSRAVVAVAVVASVGSFATNKAYLPVADAVGAHVMFLLFAAVNAAWALCVHLFLFETKGMTLSAIQDVLDDYNSSDSDSEASQVDFI